MFAYIAVVDKVNDLGVVIDSRLMFHTHIRTNVVRASVRAKLIHKCFISRDAFTRIRAFKVYVKAILEYASCTWSPHHILKIQPVENVQRKFTKRSAEFRVVEARGRCHCAQARSRNSQLR